MLGGGENDREEKTSLAYLHNMLHTILIPLSSPNLPAFRSYSKACKAVVECSFEIDEDNVKHLHKKGHEFKLDGVGKGTADKMKEFLKTGTCAKLEEKRAAALG